MLKRFTILLVAVVGLLMTGRTAQAFSLLGPLAGNAPVSWQTPTIGYDFNSDIGGVMNRGEGYRWNVPVITYAVDDSFVEYFGARGITEVEKALASFNNLTNFSLMSSSLNEFPLRTSRVNFRAQTLGLLDLKSTTLRALVEELGLTEAERYIYTLRARNVATIGTTTWTNYLVILRSFDPATQLPSSFVNNTLYTYQIEEGALPGGGPGAEALERPVDPLAFINTSVSYSAPNIGGYFTGLTRDDVGGLRYLYGTNNIAAELLLPDTQLVATNATEFELRTDDLGLLSRRSTNSLITPLQMLTTYPGIQLASVVTNLLLVNLTNTVGSNIVVTPTVTNVYTYTYANVVTNFTTNQALVTVRTVEVTSNQFGFSTNILSQTSYLTNESAGSFYIITNGIFAYEILQPFNTVTVDQTTLLLTNTTTSIFITNTSPQARVTIEATNDLYELIQFSSTNNPAAVLARYPGLLITSTNIYLTNVLTQQYVSYLTNSPYDTPFSLGALVTITNTTTNVITGYSYTFGNVVTNQNYANGFLTSLNINIGFTSTPYAPAGYVTLTTNVSSSTYFTAYPNGTFYIVPTNLVGYNIVSTFYESPIAITNTLVNSSAVVSGVTLSNIVLSVRYRTNTVLLAEPILLNNPTNVIITATGIHLELVRTITNVTYRARALQLQNSATVGPVVRRGVDKLRFRRMPFDSVLGRVISPVTNYFTTSLSITNGTNVFTASQISVTNVYTTSGYRLNNVDYGQIEQRIVTVPDFLFAAADLGFTVAADGSQTPVLFRRTVTDGWNNHDNINGSTALGGPGVIEGQVQILFNNVGPSVTHQTPQNLDQAHPYFINYAWGSYDGSGDEPFIYPPGTDINALEQQILNGP